jgi:NuA3 HAT complex component NTO1
MEIDPFSVPPGQAFPPGASFDETVIQRTTMDASGRVVIEELDTPLTRRQKSMKKKAEKRRSAGMADLPGFSLAKVGEHGAGENVGDMVMSSPAPPPSSAGGPSTPAPPSASAPNSSAVAGPSSTFRIPALPKQQSDNNEDMESESELSELSELPSEIASSQRSGAMHEEEEPVPKKTPSQAKRVRGKRRLMELYESGTLGMLILLLPF